MAGNEQHAVVAGDSSIAGLLICGAMGGATGVERIQCLIDDDDAMNALATWYSATGMRLVCAELPAEPVFANAARALEKTGFVEESRIANFIDEGIALRLLVLRPVALSQIV